MGESKIMDYGADSNRSVRPFSKCTGNSRSNGSFWHYKFALRERLGGSGFAAKTASYQSEKT
jgi:hypothetical protein